MDQYGFQTKLGSCVPKRFIYHLGTTANNRPQKVSVSRVLLPVFCDLVHGGIDRRERRLKNSPEVAPASIGVFLSPCGFGKDGRHKSGVHMVLAE